MSFVKGFKFDIFVSYSHVDDALSTGATQGWVEAFTQELRVQMAQKLGRSDLLSVFKDDEQLPGHVPLTSEILEKLRESAVMITILSRGYLISDWCLRELRSFCGFDATRRSRIFIVERTNVPPNERPPEMKDLNGYKFWGMDRHAFERPISVTPPVFQPDAFYQALGHLVTELAEELARLKENSAEPSAAVGSASIEIKSEPVEAVVEAMALHITPLTEELRAPQLSDGLFVGVGEFDERSYLPRLRHANDDAVALAHLFTIDLQLIAPDRVRLATAGETQTPESKVRMAALEKAGVRRVPATRTELMLAFQELADSRKSAPEGLLVATFSTHGYEEKGTVYLMPADGVRRFTTQTGVPLSMLQMAFHEGQAKTKLVILDICRSSGEGGIKGTESMSAGFERSLKETDGLALLCSCGEGQSSWESRNLGLGVFTHFLRAGLLGAAPARPEDGVIALDSVFAYAMANTNQFVRKKISVEQLPWCGNRNLIEGLPFALSREVSARARELVERKAKFEARKENALRNLFEARRANRGLISAAIEHVERELDFLSGEALEELIENLEKLADRKPSSCRLFSAWWDDQHVAPVIHSASRPAAGRPWMNSLGLNFVPVGDVLFAVYLTRVQDFREFARETGYKPDDGDFFLPQAGELVKGDFSWNNPGFQQGPTHPVVGVNWIQADAFCRWLTDRERAADLLTSSDFYSVPTDAMWSEAVGSDRFPWGDAWPPPAYAGNYAVTMQAGGESSRPPGTTPVGKFPPNRYGISDLGGNAWEWCADWYQKEMNSPALRAEYPFLDDDGGGGTYRFLRGGSWYNWLPRDLLSGYRNVAKYPDSRLANVGFRIVLNIGGAQKAAAIRA